MRNGFGIVGGFFVECIPCFRCGAKENLSLLFFLSFFLSSFSFSSSSESEGSLGKKEKGMLEREKRGKEKKQTLNYTHKHKQPPYPKVEEEAFQLFETLFVHSSSLK